MAKFYSIKKIRAENGSNIGRVDVYGFIEAAQFWGDEVTPASFVNDLNALGAVSEIECHIFSGGGDMFASLSIYTILKSRPEKVTVYIDGLAASGGSIIACAGDVVYMPPTAMMFVHNLLTSVYDVNENDVTDLLAEMQKIKEPMINAYMQKSGRTRDEVIALMDGESGNGTWLTADDAIEFGLVDASTPVEMLPMEAAACIRPGVFSYRGFRVDVTGFEKAAEKTAGIINSKRGRNSMAWYNKNKPKKAAKVKPKAEITFVEMVCPSCNGVVNLNPESGEIFAGGAEPAQPQNGGKGNAPQAAFARRMPGNVRAEVYTVNCPHCGNDFIWDTDVNADGEGGQETKDAAPLGGSNDAGKTPAKAPGTKGKTEPKAELAQSTCPACGAEFEFDTEGTETGTDDAGTEGYLLTCPECGEEYVEPLAATEPTAIPVSATAQAAYQQGIRAERERILALEEMAQAAPGVSAMITAAIRSGTSVATTSRNVFKAMAKNPNTNAKAAQYIQALGRDVEASGVNNLRMPQHHSKTASYADKVFEALDKR
jgi:ATP-dependent protease ClpP protease subunit/endogenous inhibitor of DNA gyrase (YacG/DUF329 family)/uncharacterized OB-fold protein